MVSQGDTCYGHCSSSLGFVFTLSLLLLISRSRELGVFWQRMGTLYSSIRLYSFLKPSECLEHCRHSKRVFSLVQLSQQSLKNLSATSLRSDSKGTFWDILYCLWYSDIVRLLCYRETYLLDSNLVSHSVFLDCFALLLSFPLMMSLQLLTFSSVLQTVPTVLCNLYPQSSLLSCSFSRVSCQFCFFIISRSLREVGLGTL